MAYKLLEDFYSSLFLSRIKNKNNIKIYYIYILDELIGFMYNINVYYYLKDIEKRIVGIILGTSVVAKYQYSAYGVIIYFYEESFISGINKYFYKSYYYDNESNMYYLKNRYYSLDILRFISPDNYNYLNLENHTNYNLYAYCNNNPIINDNNEERPIPKKELIYDFQGVSTNHFFSSGWEASDTLYKGPFIRFGISTYVTKHYGKKGVFYLFSSETKDIYNEFERKYGVGFGLNFFDKISFESKFNLTGVGIQIGILDSFLDIDVDLAGLTSITIGKNTNINDKTIKSDALTFGINTKALIVIILALKFGLGLNYNPALIPAFA